MYYTNIKYEESNKAVKHQTTSNPSESWALLQNSLLLHVQVTANQTCYANGGSFLPMPGALYKRDCLKNHDYHNAW